MRRRPRERNPLKQGLKQGILGVKKEATWPRERNPLKQGLKPGNLGQRSRHFFTPRERNPLKQGLKQIRTPTGELLDET